VYGSGAEGYQRTVELMAISAMSAATTACEESGWTLTNLELQNCYI
jgi:hypothetical protein